MSSTWASVVPAGKVPKDTAPPLRRPLCPSWRAGFEPIPACAGEPHSGQAVRPGQKVYPRVCGGTTWAPGQACNQLGLSPRVRGNQCGCRGLVGPDGSIPACAGEPNLERTGSSSLQGLSPRVRGNRREQGRDVLLVGSIPACAGEPPGPGSDIWYARVYPRVCGGTVCARGSGKTVVGLSPRVRGNPLAPARTYQAERSIPACAGEPFTHRLRLNSCGAVWR